MFDFKTRVVLSQNLFIFVAVHLCLRYDMTIMIYDDYDNDHYDMTS